jgi:hypothetical protein
MRSLLLSVLLALAGSVLLALAGCAPADPLQPIAELVSDTGLIEDLRAELPARGLALVVQPDRLRVAPLGPFEGFEEEHRAVLELPADLPLQDGRFPEDQLRGMLADPLYDLLLERAEAWKHQGDVMLIEEHDFRGELWLLVDRRVAFEDLRVVMYTAGQAQYSEFQVVSFGQVEAPVVAPAPADAEAGDDRGGVLAGAVADSTQRPDPRVGLRVGELHVKRSIDQADQPLPRFEVDDRGATFTISAPKDDTISPVLTASPERMDGILDADPGNPRLYPSYAAAIHAAAHPVLPSLELLLQVSKVADDRMMAALERHQAPGRSRWIEDALRAQLASGLGGEETTLWLAAAAMLGGQEIDGLGLSPGQLAGAAELVRAFEEQPQRAKPVGIYSEASDLAAIFARDRFLLSPLDMGKPRDRAVALGLQALLASQPELAERLRWDQALQAQLTNPSRAPGVLALDPDILPPEAYLLPPATSREAELIASLGGTAMVGPHTMDAFVQAVRDGTVSLSPREESGWYDHQQWALEPLLSLPEGEVLLADEGYRQRLEDAFEAAIASRRETHIKSLALPAIGAAWSERVAVTVAPQLRVEPLPTHYERSASAYDFLLAAVLEPYLDTAWESWDQGAVASDLREAQRLYRDAAAIARADLGLDAGLGEPVDATAAWLEAWWEDPRLDRDLRFMIPFGETLQRDPIAWAVLGVKLVDITVAYERPPRVRSLTPGVELDVTLAEARYTLPVLVFAELPVASILDRQELRALADRHPTQRALLEALAPPRPEPSGGCQR